MLASSFERYLRAANRSARTVQTYMEAVHQLVHFLTAGGYRSRPRRCGVNTSRPTCSSSGSRAARPRPVSNRFRALQQFFPFLVDEGEITESHVEAASAASASTASPTGSLVARCRRVASLASIRSITCGAGQGGPKEAAAPTRARKQADAQARAAAGRASAGKAAAVRVARSHK